MDIMAWISRLPAERRCLRQHPATLSSAVRVDGMAVMGSIRSFVTPMERRRSIRIWGLLLFRRVGRLFRVRSSGTSERPETRRAVIFTLKFAEQKIRFKAL